MRKHDIIEDPGAVKRTDARPTSSKPCGRITRLKGNEIFLGIVLSPKFWGFEVHFETTARRSFGCQGNPENCFGCRVGIPISVKRYLCCKPATDAGPAWVEFPETLAVRWEDALGPVKTFRGVRFELRRTNANNGRLQLDIREYSCKDPDALPPDRDPLELLTWLWNREGR